MLKSRHVPLFILLLISLYSSSLSNHLNDHESAWNIESLNSFPKFKRLHQFLYRSNAPWGLAAMTQSQRPLPDSLKHLYKIPNSNGAGTVVYLIDSGVDIYHPELKGKVTVGPNYSSNPNNNHDEYGHGTHVAGIILGTHYGLATQATMVSIKLLDKDGNGWISSAVKAIQWVIQQHKSRGSEAKSVINLSFNGDSYAALDFAVEEAVNAGIIVVACAGNLEIDACSTSPAASRFAITVAAAGLVPVNATEKNDMWKNVFADFSNYGSCIDIIAPGMNILSTFNGGGSKFMEGTSMAAPHVAGAAAIWLSQSPKNTSPSAFKSWLHETSLKNVVDFLNFTTAAQNTPNEFLFL